MSLVSDNHAVASRHADPLPVHTGKNRTRLFHLVAVSAAYIACFIPIWCTPYFPSQNGPWFLLPTHMFIEYDNPQYNYADYFVRMWHPIPHMLHDALVGVISVVVPLLIAEKLMLSLYVILLPASVYALLRVAAPQRTYLAYLSFSMVLSYPFFRGYHDYTLSIPLFFFTLAYWMWCRESQSFRVCAVLAIMSLLVYLSHLFTFALLVGVIGWIRLHETGSLKRALGAALLVTWPGWLLSLDYVWLNAQSSWINKSDTQWLPLHWTIENFIRQYFYSVSLPAYVAAVAVWLWVPLAILWQWAWSRLPLRAVVALIARQPIASLALVLCVAYLMVPYKLLGWHKVNVRLIPFILGLGVLSVGQASSLKLSWKMQHVVAGWAVLGVVMISTFVTPEIRRMQRQLEIYTSGIEHFEENSLLLPIHVENPAYGGIRPLTRAHQYYHLAKGGANGHSIAAMNTLALMWYRRYPVKEMFPDYDAQRPDESLRVAAEVYDYVLTMGEDDKLRNALGAAQFRLVHSSANVRLYRNFARKRKTASRL